MEFTKHDGKILSVKEANEIHISMFQNPFLSKRKYRECLYWQTFVTQNLQSMIEGLFLLEKLMQEQVLCFKILK